MVQVGHHGANHNISSSSSAPPNVSPPKDETCVGCSTSAGPMENAIAPRAMATTAMNGVLSRCPNDRLRGAGGGGEEVAAYRAA